MIRFFLVCLYEFKVNKYYDQNQKIIQSDELETLIKTKDDYVLFICELETP